MDQIDLLRHALGTLERLAIPYMLVGSYASIAYGEPRFTRDIDIVVDIAPEKIAEFCRAFPSPEFFLSRDAVEQAVRDAFQFNVLHPASGNKIDFILPRRDDWGRTQLARRQEIMLLPDRTAIAAKPEDVIIGKMLYYAEGGSEKHLRDICGILRVSGDMVDRDEIARWANRLGVSEVWGAVLQKLGQ
jgi:predicted nucleotidyltransferase